MQKDVQPFQAVNDKGKRNSRSSLNYREGEAAETVRCLKKKKKCRGTSLPGRVGRIVAKKQRRLKRSCIAL